MATKLKVTYDDGRELVVLASPRAQVETERHFRGQGIVEINQVEAGYYLAWASLHFAGKEADEFEAWLNHIDDVDDVTKTVQDEISGDPTPKAALSTGSSA